MNLCYKLLRNPRRRHGNARFHPPTSVALMTLLSSSSYTPEPSWLSNSLRQRGHGSTIQIQELAGT
jgi:hypothetical protein